MHTLKHANGCERLACLNSDKSRPSRCAPLARGQTQAQFDRQVNQSPQKKGCCAPSQREGIQGRFHLLPLLLVPHKYRCTWNGTCDMSSVTGRSRRRDRENRRAGWRLDSLGMPHTASAQTIGGMYARQSTGSAGQQRQKQRGLRDVCCALHWGWGGHGPTGLFGGQQTAIHGEERSALTRLQEDWVCG